MLAIFEIRDRISSVCRKYGIKRAYLFGSQARGEATENSDYDIRIEKGKLKDLFALSALRLDLVETLGKDVDLLSALPDQAEIRKAILHDEVLVYSEPEEEDTRNECK